MTPMCREHRWTVMFCNQQKRPHRGLPFGTMFCLGPITSAVGTSRKWHDVRHESEKRSRTDIAQKLKSKDLTGVLAERPIDGRTPNSKRLCNGGRANALLLERPLPTPPRSPDRTWSPVAVSRKREYFKYPPETIGDFAPAAPNFGGRRPIGNSQKPAIGGHF
jgi:hypothetical protein